MPLPARVHRFARGLALLIALLVTLDVCSGLEWLGTASRLGLLVVGLALLPFLSARNTPLFGRVLRPAVLLLVLAASAVGAWTGLQVARLEADWAEIGRTRLLARAAAIGVEFGELVARMEAPAEELARGRYSEAYSTDPTPTPRLFELLDEAGGAAALAGPRFGISLLDFDGVGFTPTDTGCSVVVEIVRE